ncbi:hypothetical protein D7X98_00765 [bacterium 1XD8-76]|nr:hypothetical protein D7X98_00765 [bacterium 1XD8-76]
MNPKLIVMLTHHDRTVDNAVEIFESCRHTKAEYWGFKEVGIPLDEMKKLCTMMKKAGKTTFLEVVAYTEKECLEGAKMAGECGFDYLMGTMYFDSIRDYVKEAGLKYLPFVGKIVGRPSVLEGTVEGIVEEAKSLLEKGVDGFDLLGYRFTGDPVELNNTFVKEAGAPVCLAGSVDSYKRLDEVKASGSWAFTIGGAFFENKFDGSFAEQIDKVVEYMEK